MAACCLVTPVFGQSKFKPRLSSTASETPRDEQPSDTPAKLGDFAPVPGTSYLMARISADGEKLSKSSIRLTGTSSATHFAGGIHNLVFFDLKDDSTKALFPDAQRLITAHTMLPQGPIPEKTRRKAHPSIEIMPTEDQAAAESGPAKPVPVQWHVIEYVHRDTNGDGVINRHDTGTLAVADAGGHRCIDLISPLGEVFVKHLADEETLLVIHGSQARQSAVRIHLPTRKITSSTTLPNFGTR